MDSFIEMTYASDPLREPVLRSAIQALELPPGSHGLDAGCGIGLQALLLSDAVGAAGRITGIDLSPENVAHAREVVKRAGRSQRIGFEEADVARLPFPDGSFDWAWSVDCVGYAAIDPLPPVRELARVVRPGGSVILLAWSSEMLLPGHPLLEAHLAATRAGVAPFAEGMPPERHFLRALGVLRAAGLEDLAAHTFAGGVHAPLTPEIRGALLALLEMRWPEVEPELTPQDRAEYRRICLPESPDFILDHPDYCAFFTYSMFRGRVPARHRG